MPRASSSSPAFRFSSKYIFLTYPHATITALLLLDTLWEKLSSHLIYFIAVATELHADGTPHLHCLIQLDKRPCIRSASFFDVQNNHPNIQPARNSSQVLDYISKDGSVITRGTFRSHKVSPSKRDSQWRTIIETSTSKEEYLNSWVCNGACNGSFQLPISLINSWVSGNICSSTDPRTPATPSRLGLTGVLFWFYFCTFKHNNILLRKTNIFIDYQHS